MTQEKDYFVHETAFVDDSVSIGGGQRYGIIVIYPQVHLLVSIVILDKMCM